MSQAKFWKLWESLKGQTVQFKVKFDSLSSNHSINHIRNVSFAIPHVDIEQK